MASDGKTSLTPDEEAKQGRALAKEMQEADLYRATELQCDLVMKGGIASGVVYPLTVCKLATQYRLRNIGGTSAGAIAAVLAGAAEYRRQRTGRGNGFSALAALPQVMARDLEGLFTPNASAGPIFALLKAPMGRSGLPRIVSLLVALTWHRKVWFVASIAACLGFVLAGLVLVDGVPASSADWRGLAPGLIPALLPAFVVGAAGAAAGMALLARKILPTLDFGLTNGVHGEPKLSSWMYRQINTTAGRGASEAPLTLGELWGSDAMAAWKDAVADPANPDGETDPEGRSGAPDALRRRRVVDLQLMTTELTTGRPMRLPFQEQQVLLRRR